MNDVWMRIILTLASIAFSACTMQQTPVAADEANQLIEKESPPALHR